jgi:multiple sugar transport system permease protein
MLTNHHRPVSLQSLRRATGIGILALASCVVSFPLLWMVISTFKPRTELWLFPPVIFPIAPTLDGFRMIFQRMPFARYFVNSVLVSVCATSLALFTSSLAGYIFAKIRFRGRDLLFVLVLSSMMIPSQVTIIPNYMIIRSLGLLNTYFALILPQGISVFGIFLVRQFMHGLPQDYIDAARIDGMREFSIYRRVILPLGKPVLATLAIFSFRGSWDSLLWPLIMTSTNEMRTLPAGIAGLATVHSPEYHLMLPAATLAVVPVLVVFTIFQRQFVEGIAMSGLKA